MRRALLPITLSFVLVTPLLAQGGHGGGGGGGNRLPAQSDTVTAPGWTFRAGKHGASIRLDTAVRHGGAAALHVRLTPLETEGGMQGFWPPNVMQALDARPYRDRRVRLSMWVKTGAEKVDKRVGPFSAGLWMRIDNEDGTNVFVPATVSPMSSATDWSRKVIVLEVPSNAYNIAFGVLSGGWGELWIDDVTLEDQGPSSGQAQVTRPPQPMSPEQLAQAIARAATRPPELVNGGFEGK